MLSLLRYVREHWHEILLVVGIVAVVALVSVTAFLRWRTAHYVGQIVARDEGSLTVENPHGDRWVVLYDDATTIHRGRVRVSPIVGDMVMVVGEVDAEGKIHARMVRVIESKTLRGALPLGDLLNEPSRTP